MTKKDNLKKETEEAKSAQTAQQGDGAQEQATQNGADGSVTLSAEQFAELKSRIEALQKERDEYLDFAQRTQAEFDNFRRRNACLRADSLDEGARETIKALIGSLDSFERAMKVAEETGVCGPFADGVALVYRQFSDALTKLGVCEIAAQGEKFDPELHHAILQEPAEGTEPGTVTDVLQKGYKHKDKIVRHAMVKVAQ